jgi:hypothetical protein
VILFGGKVKAGNNLIWSHLTVILWGIEEDYFPYFTMDKTENGG